MIEVKYQLVTIGLSNSFKHAVIDTVLERIDDLGIDRSSVDLLDQRNFFSRHENNAPTVGLYFGGVASTFPDQKILDDLIHGARIYFQSWKPFMDLPIWCPLNSRV